MMLDIVVHAQTTNQWLSAFSSIVSTDYKFRKGILKELLGFSRKILHLTNNGIYFLWKFSNTIYILKVIYLILFLHEFIMIVKCI